MKGIGRSCCGAFESCRATKSGSDQARAACVVVGTQNKCFAFAGANWVLSATEQAARVQVFANCYGQACTVSSGCDSEISRQTAP
jgi:hypothetical protein